MWHVFCDVVLWFMFCGVYMLCFVCVEVVHCDNCIVIYIIFLAVQCPAGYYEVSNVCELCPAGKNGYMYVCA